MENENKNQGTNMFERNMEVTVFRGIGPGFETMTAFTQCVNKNSRSDPTYRNINDHFLSAYKSTTLSGMY